MVILKEGKTIYTIWAREMVRTWRNRIKVISGLLFPFLWLVFFGVGVSTNMLAGNFSMKGAVSYMQFLVPGVIAMTVLFSSMFSAISIVNDREFGFLKEVLVSPAARWAVAAGKALGGASVATLSGAIMFALVPFLGVRFPVGSLLVLIPALFLGAFMLTALGLAIAARIRSSEGFQFVMQFMLMPMFILSGALFPVSHLPHWMDFFVKINPATYFVDFLRQLFFRALNFPASEIREAFSPALFGHPLGLRAEALIISAIAIGSIIWAMILFNKHE